MYVKYRFTPRQSRTISFVCFLKTEGNGGKAAVAMSVGCWHRQIDEKRKIINLRLRAAFVIIHDIFTEACTENRKQNCMKALARENIFSKREIETLFFFLHEHRKKKSDEKIIFAHLRSGSVEAFNEWYGLAGWLADVGPFSRVGIFALIHFV